MWHFRDTTGHTGMPSWGLTPRLRAPPPRTNVLSPPYEHTLSPRPSHPFPFPHPLTIYTPLMCSLLPTPPPAGNGVHSIPCSLFFAPLRSAHASLAIPLVHSISDTAPLRLTSGQRGDTKLPYRARVSPPGEDGVRTSLFMLGYIWSVFYQPEILIQILKNKLEK